MDGEILRCILTAGFHHQLNTLIRAAADWLHVLIECWFSNKTIQQKPVKRLTSVEQRHGSKCVHFLLNSCMDMYGQLKI